MIIAINNMLNPSLISTPIFKEFEDVWVQLDAFNNNIVIGCVYIPPNSPVDVYRSFASTCEHLRNKFTNHKFLLYGDFNLPQIKWVYEDDTLVPTEVSQVAEDIIDTMYFLELQQINPIHNAFGKTLDLIFADDFNKSVVTRSSFPLLPIDIHHPPIEMILDLQHFKRLISNNTITVHQFRHSDYTGLNQYFHLIGKKQKCKNFTFVVIFLHF